jgi:hypothetical protein
MGRTPAVVLATMLGALAACQTTDGPGDPDTDASTVTGVREWRTAADAPLGPRHGTAVAWTGDEVVLVGGDTEPPCPPGADCAYSPRPGAGAAAYDPAADSWRELPDVPAPVMDARAWWTGRELILVGSGHTFALDPARDAWRRLGDSPDVGSFVVPTDEGLVFVAYDQGPGDDPADWILDPQDASWSALPRDPFGESYDRSMAWDGERLWLLSMAVQNHFRAGDGAASRLAVLDDGEWRVVDERTPPATYEQDMWWHDEQLVVPAGTYGGRNRAYVPGSGTWSTAASAEEAACPVPAAGSGPDWLSGGAELVSVEPRGTVSPPPCPALTRGVSTGPDVAVWAGATLFVWGSDFERETTTGLLWTPPGPAGG